MDQSHVLAHGQLVPVAQVPLGATLGGFARPGAATSRLEHLQLFLREFVQVE